MKPSARKCPVYQCREISSEDSEFRAIAFCIICIYLFSQKAERCRSGIKELKGLSAYDLSIKSKFFKLIFHFRDPFIACHTKTHKIRFKRNAFGGRNNRYSKELFSPFVFTVIGKTYDSVRRPDQI